MSIDRKTEVNQFQMLKDMLVITNKTEVSWQAKGACFAGVIDRVNYGLTKAFRYVSFIIYTAFQIPNREPHSFALFLPRALHTFCPCGSRLPIYI